MNIDCQCGEELVEMSVHRCIAIGMPDIDGLTESCRLDLYSGDITVGCCMYRLVLLVLGTDIQSHVIVIGPKLAEVGGQAHRKVQRVPEITLRIGYRCKQRQGG